MIRETYDSLTKINDISAIRNGFEVIRQADRKSLVELAKSIGYRADGSKSAIADRLLGGLEMLAVMAAKNEVIRSL